MYNEEKEVVMSSNGGSMGNKVPKGYEQGSLSNFSPEQMQLFQSLFSQLGPNSQTAKLAGGDQSTFEEIERPALQQFSALQGNLGSRFSGMGMGARKSSGFQNAGNQQLTDFASQLQSQRQSLQQQALRDLIGHSNQILGQRTHENFLTEKQKPFWQELAIAAAPGIASGGTNLGVQWAANKFMNGFTNPSPQQPQQQPTQLSGQNSNFFTKLQNGLRGP